MSRTTRLLASGVSVLALLTACGQDSGATGPVRVGVILPETDTSVRWESFDRPYLEKALRAHGLEPDIQNAQGDEQKFSTLADGMIARHVDVLIMTSMNSEVGDAVSERAKAAGIPTIDYDRINLGGSSEYYVSFDNETVGEMQGRAMAEALRGKKGARVIQIEGSPTDNIGTQDQAGHDRVLKPLYDSGDLVLLGSRRIEGWSNEIAGTTFEQMLTGHGGKVDGVVVANDGMAGAVVNVLEKYGLNGKVPVTGQDATPLGLQAVLRGDFYMTVYKPIDRQAKAAADLAAALAKGDTAAADKLASDSTNDPVGKRKVKSVLLDAETITKDTVKSVIDAGFVAAADVCVDDLVATCRRLGITVP
jgi:D-xylose transport system substrate-binding protein